MECRNGNCSPLCAASLGASLIFPGDFCAAMETCTIEPPANRDVATGNTSSTDSSSKAAESSSPSNSDEKSEKKMDKLKDKLKTKLHIGSKDK